MGYFILRNYSYLAWHELLQQRFQTYTNEHVLWVMFRVWTGPTSKELFVKVIQNFSNLILLIFCQEDINISSPQTLNDYQ